MNTKEALKQLAQKLCGYDFIFHPKFLEELRSLLSKELKGKEDKFFKCLTNQLKYIHDFGILVYQTDGHEQIKGFDGHYFSIHIELALLTFYVLFMKELDIERTIILLILMY